LINVYSELSTHQMNRGAVQCSEFRLKCNLACLVDAVRHPKQQHARKIEINPIAHKKSYKLHELRYNKDKTPGKAPKKRAAPVREYSMPAVAVHEIRSARADETVPGVQFAVIGFKGRQFKVVEGDEVVVPLPPHVEVGDQYIVRDVLMVGSHDRTVIGRSTVPGAVVALQVEEIARAPKVLVFKKKRRKGYRKTRGHRQPIMALSVRSIEVDEAAMVGSGAPAVGELPAPLRAADLPPLALGPDGKALPRQRGPLEELVKWEGDGDGDVEELGHVGEQARGDAGEVPAEGAVATGTADERQ